MRIVAGKLKSRIIQAPDNSKTRPTSDRTRESIFNVIAPYVYDANVLDVFAGSGALGIEAISRGARFACFIDADIDAINCIKKNVLDLKIDDKCKIIHDDYKIISTFKDKKFDVILLDPPYALEMFEDFLKMINENNLLSDNGVIVYESNENNFIKDEINGFNVKVKKYGIAYVSFLYKVNVK